MCFLALFVGSTVIHALRPKYRRIYGWAAPFRSALHTVLSVPNWIYQLAILTILLAPWWWASVLLVGLAARGPGWSLSATTVFVGGFAGLHLAHLLFLFAGPRANHRFRHRVASDAEPVEPRRVAVIGAGMAGLVAAKELKEAGHHVTVYERTSGWGGVWASSKQRGGRAWGSTITSTGALNTTLSDSPTRIENPANGDTPLHFTRQQFLDMLVDYERRYRVFDGSLRPDTEVVSMERAGEEWRLGCRHRSGKDEREEYEVFDAVTICTGLNHDPWIPDLPGRGNFTGPELHVDDFDFGTPERYAGQRVLIVGLGETAADLAEDLARVGADLNIAPRGSTVTLARNFGSIPPDYNENRVVYAGPMFNRWSILLTGLPIMVTNLIRPTRVRQPSFRNWLRIFRPHRTSGAFPSIMASANATKSDYLWRLLDQGRATLTKQVKAVTPTGVELVDGSALPVDAIVYCTGYRTSNRFLPLTGPAAGTEEGSGANGEIRLSSRDLYKLTIPPELPGVAVIGYARGMIGAITLSTELQARWWALIVSGKRSLPGVPTMRREADRLRRRSRRFSQATRTTLTLASSLARNDVGCEPDMVDLFLHDRPVWWRLLNHPMCAAHYRLHGVGAKPGLARQQLTMPGSLHSADYIDGVDVAYNVLPLAAVLQPIWPLLERLVPIPSTRRALDTYI